MKIHTNRKLFDLANRNAQRLARNRLLEENAQALAWLAGAESFFHPDTPDMVKNALARAIANHSPCGIREENVAVLQTARADKAYACLTDWVTHLPEGDYFLSFGGGSMISFDNSIQWIPVLPVFALSLKSITPFLDTLRPFCNGDIALVSSCGRHAVISESLMGYLPDEPSDDETVYELSTWSESTA
ncbi:hypothetical protein LJC19_07245 [Oxalobacter sp. OttesenSCG-928-P03]|nr:hypothetical protein [Oxalobacter sp. OttesenSCG-928-P03]